MIILMLKSVSHRMEYTDFDYNDLSSLGLSLGVINP